MNIRIRLIIMSFLQFFVWGAWLITIGVYWFETKKWSSSDFGNVFTTLAISAIFMPPLLGIISDRWINSEKLYGILHLCYGAVLFFLPPVNNPHAFFWVMLLAMFFYMPTISLSCTISYYILKNNHFNVVKIFPSIRIWGTIGFVVAMWVTNLTGNKALAGQFYIASVFAILLGVYAFFLPKCPPQNLIPPNSSLFEKLGLSAFKLFRNKKMRIFFIFSVFLGGASQLTNMYGDVFLSDFNKIPAYADSFVVKYSTIIMSISQISETLFILTIPFFIHRFGIKNVMLISMFAWVLRFALFAYGHPEGIGLFYIILSCVFYGMAFDFFHISGSLFVETNTDFKIRSSAQGLFIMMINGFGTYLGAKISGKIVDKRFTLPNGDRMWHEIWLSCAGYALIVAILFFFFFKHQHTKTANIQTQ